MRVTIKQLEQQVKYLNELTGNPTTPYTRKDGRNNANIGNYNISQAYGGVCLHQITNAGGGVTCPLMQGHEPKKDLDAKLRAFITGIELKLNK